MRAVVYAEQGITHHTLQAMYAHAHYLTNLLPNFQKGAGGLPGPYFYEGVAFLRDWGVAIFTHTKKTKS